jgi:hypothetical protein
VGDRTRHPSDRALRAPNSQYGPDRTRPDGYGRATYFMLSKVPLGRWFAFCLGPPYDSRDTQRAGFRANGCSGLEPLGVDARAVTQPHVRKRFFRDICPARAGGEGGGSSSTGCGTPHLHEPLHGFLNFRRSVTTGAFSLICSHATSTSTQRFKENNPVPAVRALASNLVTRTRSAPR